jgi:hypothetical protein
LGRQAARLHDALMHVLGSTKVRILIQLAPNGLL